MRKPRRSLIRSSLQRLRQLWKRREDGRRDMRRALGSTFELLEPRLALTISSPLPGATDHIHPVLQIYLEGQQVAIPSGVGLLGSTPANPHTHDLSGTLHIGEEGSPAGTGTTVRNVTLDDFFDVWSSSTLTPASALNTSAVFDTKTGDGTDSPRILNKTVDGTHVLRMYVKEAGDATPELEYDSSSSTNSLAHPEDYVPRDGDQIIISFDKTSSVVDAPSFQPIATQNVLGGAPTVLGIDGFDVTGGPLTYSISSSNPSLLAATLMPTSNKSLVMNVNGFGQMTFQLFDNLAPRTTQHIETLVNNGEFTTNSKFYRIAHLQDGSDFVIQGGPANSTSSLGQFDDEFNTDLQFTSKGLLAMAKSTDDTNDSQIFITGQPVRFLDMQHSIFGVLTDGDEIRNAIQKSRTTGDGPPPSDIVINSAQIITDTQNAALLLKAAEGASGQADVTVTVTDAQNHTFSQTFHVNITPDSANSAPFLNTIAPVTGVQGQPITVQLAATDAENNPFFFDATKPNSETVNYSVNVNHDTGLVTINPPANFAGTFHIQFGVRGTTTTTTADQFDTQDVLVTVKPSAPSSIDLDSTSDSGTSNSDNITNASSLNFVLSGITSGATVKLMKGDTVLAQGTANGNTITLTVSNPGTALGQGTSGITAIQTVSGQTSAVSAPLSVTFDTTAPTFTSTAPASAPVGFNLNYNAQTNEEGAGLVYSLTNAPTGATINSSTGVVTWTPTSGQAGAQSFNIVATDAAGNTATQAVNVTVATPRVDFTMTLTKPDGSALTSLSPGQNFVLHFFAQDVQSQPQGVFAAYTDITFDGTKATVTGPITYSNTFGSGHSGTTTTAGLIDEAGAFAGTTPTGGNPLEVFSVPMQATAPGTLVFATDPADVPTTHDVLVYGPAQDPNSLVAANQIHFGAASIEVGSTFNAVNDSFNANEDTSNNTINPLANDTSIGGATNTLTITATGATNHGGTVSITQNGTRLAYTPAANFAGSETFTYTAKNQLGEEHVATVTMTVADVNDAPVATNDTFSASRNSTGNVLNVLANDTTGPDTGETLRVTAVGTGSQGGTITIGANGANIVYAPKANFSGTETFTYTISDRTTGGLTSQATVTVNVSGLTANPDTFTVTEDSSATTLDVLANDALDSQVGGTLTITSVGTGDKGGTITITQNSTRLSYTPAANAQGTEKFTYTISDGQGHNATATVTMTITNVNDAPTATNDTLTAFKNTTATFDVLANDTSAPDPTETLTLDSIGTQPQHGTASIVSGKVQYVPTSGYTGPDSFTYTIKDPGGLTSTATANITVQDFAPSTLSGFVYFDVNNNGLKDSGELPIVGVTITLTGTPTAGSTTPVNLTAKTAEDGSYKFENLAPGTNYKITQSQPLFTIDGKDTAGSQGGVVTNNVITIATLAQATTGINNNFGELGRALSTIKLRDFFSSTSRNFAFAAFDNSGAELWHTTSGPLWNGSTSNAFSLISNKTQVQLQSTNGQSAVTTKTFSTQLPVYVSGQSGTNALYYIPARLANGGTTPTPVNQSPTAVADTYSTPLSTALNVTAANGVLKNDTDPENNTLTATVVTQPAHGTLTLNSNGSFTYTPTTGFTGNDTFTYKASDGNSTSAAATVSISVGVNNAPTAVADSFSATEDTPLVVTTTNSILKNDTDPENNSLTAILGTAPTKGTLTSITNGTFTYTPNANANGTDTFTYKANDGTNDSAFVTVTITIAPVNDAPVAANDSYSTTKDQALTVTTPTLLANDTDVDNASLTVSTTPVTNVSHGTLSLNANGTFTYTPTAGFTGTDTFVYQASDGTLTANGTVTITINPPVNHAPVAVADSYNIDEDTATPVSASAGVLQNDTDEDNNTTLTAAVDVQPTHGTLSLNNDGSFTYTPNANYHGPDSFVYHANDGTANSGQATVTLNIVSINDAPVGVADSYQANPSTPLVVNAVDGVLKNDTDADGDTPLTAGDVTQPNNGSVTVNTDGSFTYTPNNGFSGTDTFTYQAADPSNAKSAVTTVTITVNATPVALDDTYSTNEDTPLVMDAINGVLHNDTDTETDQLTTTVITQPQHGTVTLNSNGSFTYTPNANYNGPDSFRYQASDSHSASAPATVNITVNAVNDVPVAVNDDFSTNEDTTLSVTTNNGVLGNDTDADGTTLTATVVQQPQHGTLTLNTDGTFTYVPSADFSGTDGFSYTAGDGTATSAVAAVTITVNPVNDAPQRTAGDTAAIDVDEDSANTLAVTLGLSGLTYGPGGGADETSQTLTFKITAIPAAIQLFQADGTTQVHVNDTVTLAELQDLTYKTVADANGAGDLTWTVQDSGGTAAGGVDTLTESLAVTVNPVNDAPTFTIQSNPPAALPNAGEQTVTGFASGISAGPADEGTQTLTFTITMTGSSGGLTFSSGPAIDSSGNLTYTPTAGTSGTATFSVILTDSGDGTAPNVNQSIPHTFTITVGEGEGESVPLTANDAALLAYLLGDNSSLEVPAANWQDAVDQAMAQLG